MAAPDVPGAKRAGLPVDLDRLEREGDGWLTPEDRYALKTHGICAQAQAGVFMMRVRVAGGLITTAQARGLARIARRHGPDWLHLTTRQNAELHWIPAERVKSVLAELARVGLSARSACGHTMRNVMCSEDAGLGLDEPFDCFPDARLVSDVVLARSAELNCVLPSRINIAFGGSPRCREDALVNDAGFVSVLRDGEPGYELWAGGSLGKAPSLAMQLSEFVPRPHVLAAAVGLIDVFVEHGDFDHPAKGRMKFVVDRLGPAAFSAAWDQAFAAANDRLVVDVPAVEVLDDDARTAIIGSVPPGGWSLGVRPQRTAGRALVTVEIPLGDCNGADLEQLSDLADLHADGALTFSRDQDVVLRNVRHADLPRIRAGLAERGLYLRGEGQLARIRACTGSAVCALGITTAPDAGSALLASPGLARNSSLRVHISGCPNSCAQHQAGDIGLAGGKVRVGGETRDGYQVYLGADLMGGLVGQVVGRVAEKDVPAAVELLVGLWESLRHPGETMGVTARRVGLDAIAAHVEAVMADRWATGSEPEAVSTIVD